jgi:hypothetical protein
MCITIISVISIHIEHMSTASLFRTFTSVARPPPQTQAATFL